MAVFLVCLVVIFCLMSALELWVSGIHAEKNDVIWCFVSGGLGLFFLALAMCCLWSAAHA